MTRKRTKQCKIIPTHKEKRIVEEYKRGVAVSTIGKRVGYSAYLVSRILRGKGIEPQNRSHHKKLTRQEEKEIVDAYINGVSIHELKNRYGVGRATILKVIGPHKKQSKGITKTPSPSQVQKRKYRETGKQLLKDPALLHDWATYHGMELLRESVSK